MIQRLSPQVNKVYDWLDERTGIKAIVRHALDEPIRGGARWAYVFGSALLLLLAVQVLTGIFLTMYYVPSADHAHVSVAYIQKVVAGGSLVRGLHYYGSSALVVLVVAHIAQTFLFGAYKRKRELLWVAGGTLLILLTASLSPGNYSRGTRKPTSEQKSAHRSPVKCPWRPSPAAHYAGRPRHHFAHTVAVFHVARFCAPVGRGLSGNAARLSFPASRGVRAISRKA